MILNGPISFDLASDLASDLANSIESIRAQLIRAQRIEIGLLKLNACLCLNALLLKRMFHQLHFRH